MAEMKQRFGAPGSTSGTLLLSLLLATSLTSSMALAQAPLTKEEEAKRQRGGGAATKQPPAQQQQQKPQPPPTQQQRVVPNTQPPPQQRVAPVNNNPPPKPFLPPRGGDRAGGSQPPTGTGTGSGTPTTKQVQPSNPNLPSQQPNEAFKKGPSTTPPTTNRVIPPPPGKVTPGQVTSPGTTTPPPGGTLPPSGVQRVTPPTLPPNTPKQVTPGTPTQPSILNPPRSGGVGAPNQGSPVPPGGAFSKTGQPTGLPTATGLPARIGVANPNPTVRPTVGPRLLDQVKQGRVESKNQAGQTIIKEPGNRTIIKQNNVTFITRNETAQFKTFAPGARTTLRPGGVSETVFVRPGGVRVFTETDKNGRLLRRFRRDPSGREVVLIDNRRFFRNVALGVGAAVLTAGIIVALAPPVHALPRKKYIVDYVDATDEDIYESLTAPPVERLERTYSLDEVRYSESLRARVRRVDLDSITFDLGSFEVTPDQYSKLERIARAMARAIEANPAEVYLIEGHTDAVGSTDDNLSLSDRRAESVARILVEHYNIPIENLVTQGYGEQNLKVETQGPERINRRVALRRITPLISQNEQN